MSTRFKAVLRAVGVFLLWTCLFAAAYAQSPLFSSNQNQYFLHGLAKAGYGTLDGDWLAGTLDPTPVFSYMVQILYTSLHQPAIFYLLYALLMGVYLFSFFGIARELFFPPPLIYLGLFFILHSAGLRFVLVRVISPDWWYALEGGFAGQRMLGLEFQPSVFGVFLVLSLFLYLKKRPYLAVLSAALSAIVHPTYLLSAALLTLAYMVDSLLLERRSPKQVIALGMLALVAVIPILIYVFMSFSGAGISLEQAAEARRVLVYFRIPHHALVREWFDSTSILKLLLIATALFLTRRTRLFLLLLVPFLGSLTLTLVQVSLNSDFLALIFPWRISVLLVPLSITVILAWLSCRLVPLRDPRLQQLLRLAPYALIALACLVGVVRFGLDMRRRASAPERMLERYIYSHPSPGEITLIPLNMETFRLAAGAPAFVDHKSIPYQAGDVLEWDRRYRLADAFYKNPTCSALEKLSEEEGITRLVITSDQAPDCPFLSSLYSDSHYKLLSIQQ